MSETAASPPAGQADNDDGGNTAQFERCTFEKNTATEVGAAFGAVSHRFFDNREGSIPLRVVDW